MKVNAELIAVRGIIASLPAEAQETVGLLADALREARGTAKANGGEAEFDIAMALVGLEADD